jgi:hypothetical protein
MQFPRPLTLRVVIGLVAALLPAGGQIPTPSTPSPGASNPGILPAKETLDYDIEWRLGTAGHARLEWYATTPKMHMGYEAKLHLESAGLVSRLYKVSDLYTVELTPTLCAESTVMTAARDPDSGLRLRRDGSTVRAAGHSPRPRPRHRVPHE